MPDENTPLDNIIEEIIDTGCRQLLAGLTILGKDLSEFLAVNAYYGPDTQRFTGIFATTLDANRFFWNSIGPQLFDPLEESGMPHGFAERVLVSNFTMAPLLEAAVDQEWTRHPGWALLLAFRNAFSDSLCQSNGVIAQHLQSGSGDTQALAKAVAAIILQQEFSENAYWYPFAGQLSVLIAKADVADYYEDCQPEDG